MPGRWDWVWLSLTDALEKCSKKLRIINIHLKAESESQRALLVASKRLSSSAAEGQRNWGLKRSWAFKRFKSFKGRSTAPRSGPWLKGKKRNHETWYGIDVLKILNSQISLSPLGLQKKAYISLLKTRNVPPIGNNAEASPLKDNVCLSSPLRSALNSLLSTRQ